MNLSEHGRQVRQSAPTCCRLEAVRRRAVTPSRLTSWRDACTVFKLYVKKIEASRARKRGICGSFIDTQPDLDLLDCGLREVSRETPLIGPASNCSLIQPHVHPQASLPASSFQNSLSRNTHLSASLVELYSSRLGSCRSILCLSLPRRLVVMTLTRPFHSQPSLLTNCPSFRFSSHASVFLPA